MVDGRQHIVLSGRGGVKGLQGRIAGHRDDPGVQTHAAAQGGEAADHQVIGPQAAAQFLESRGRCDSGVGYVATAQGRGHQIVADDFCADIGGEPGGEHVPDTVLQIAHVPGRVYLEREQGDGDFCRRSGVLLGRNG